MNRKTLLLIPAIFLAILGLSVSMAGCGKDSTQAGGDGTQEETLSELRLDYAYWSPISLVLRNKGFIEEEFSKDNIKVTWIFTTGGNKTMEYLRSNSLDIGSSAGIAAFQSFANGNPIKTIYITSTPEWAALVLKPGSDIKNIEDLKGKTIAATPGTDPYLFMVRTLSSANLGLSDVNVVTLQHPDGKNELMRGRVDAWAGLDPHMAEAELDGASYLYRNPEYNTYCVISVSKDFAKKHPDIIKRVLAVYERGRKWAKDNPEEYFELFLKEAKIRPEVGKIVLGRTTLDDDEISDKFIGVLTGAGNDLKKAGVLKNEEDIGKLVNDWIDTSFYDAVKGN